ncbi:MAG: ABC transporter permease, partial [Acidimicrobiales bacterium]
MTALVIRRALLDYARRPLNLVLLVAVPVVIVMTLSGEFATFSKLLSTTSSPTHLEVATAGWAAAAVAGLAGFFEVIGSRTTDRRLAAAAGRATPVVAGRLGASVVLAVAATAAALVALAARAGIDDPLRAISAVLVVAIIYVAIGVLVGTLVRSEMSGALV